MKRLVIAILAFVIFSNLNAADAPKPTLPGGNEKWQLFWNDEFDYPDLLLDNDWISANDSTQSNILCARIRRNAVVSNGTLKLQNKKEKVGTKAWTSGSVWTKKTFQYGYYECRYKYAAATGTNNSFWLIQQSTPALGKKFEIDINEGHYPAQMATNIHNWTDITTNPTTGAQSHPSSSAAYNFTNVNLGTEFHYYGLKWTADSLCYYFDGKKVRGIANEFSWSAAPVYLSEAIITWAGAVTDAINGTQMEVDYVRAYNPLPATEKPNCIINGGFENYQSTSDWQYLKESGITSTYTLVKTDPAEKLTSMRITAKASSSPYGTYMTQKIAIPEDGLYELRFKARSSNVTAENNKFRFKITNNWSGQSVILNDTATKWINPTSAWQSYSYKVNLKEDYSGRFTFGFANAGVFDLDSVALTRIGDIASAIPLNYSKPNNAIISTINKRIKIISETDQKVDIIELNGSVIYSSQISTGETDININRQGVYIVRIKNKSGVVTRKVILGFSE